jgi:hypothetical protein
MVLQRAEATLDELAAARTRHTRAHLFGGDLEGLMTTMRAREIAGATSDDLVQHILPKD